MNKKQLFFSIQDNKTHGSEEMSNIFRVWIGLFEGPLGQDLGEVECGNKVKVSCFKRVGYHILIKDDSYLLGELSQSLWFKVSSYCWPLTSFGQINLTFTNQKVHPPDVMDTRYKVKKLIFCHIFCHRFWHICSAREPSDKSENYDI